MDDIRDGLLEELRGRRGVLAWVKAGGRVRVGDRVEATLPEGSAGDDATV
jgi:MOSC domain-containing protein YiiM